MALASYSGLAQYDLVGVREDLSDVVSAILLGETNLLSRIGISGQATAVKHEWLEDALNANTLIDATALDVAGVTTAFAVTAGHGARTRIGTLLRNNTKGKTEILQVTTVATDTLTVVRGYGATSPEDSTLGSTWSIIGNPKQSGDDASSDVSTVRSRKSNYCQIFERGISISGDAQAVLKAGVPDELGRQTLQRMMELMRELNESIIKSYQPPATPGGSDTVYRSMSGLIEFLTAANGNSNAADEVLSPTVINDMVQQIYDDGGTPNVIACSQGQMRKISAFDADKVRYVPGQGPTGRYVTQFLSDLGVVLDVIIDRWIPPDTVMILDTTRLAVVPMASRSFGIQEIAKTGDAWKRQILGDYSLECRNALQAHAIHTNLVVS